MEETKKKQNLFIDRTGEKHITKEGYEIEIIECFGTKDCTIQFENGFIIKNKQYHNIVKGLIKNPYHKSSCGVGYLGEGKYSWKTHTKIYSTWNAMLRRCYNEAYQEKYPTYIGCSVAEEWECFQNFAQWYENNWKPYMQGWQLDKDIMVKDNKCYSFETCCFLPQELNLLFVKCNSHRGKYPIGVFKNGNKFQTQIASNGKRVHVGLFNTPEEAFQAYKTTKEKYIKEVADKWKDKLDPRVYQALINYQVEITD